MGSEISSSLSSPESTARPSNVVLDAKVERPLGVPDLLIVRREWSTVQRHVKYIIYFVCFESSCQTF
jgi:hypothetical protein